MSTEQNKALVRRLWFDELWNKWNVSVADELFSPDYLLHVAGIPEPLNRDATKYVVTIHSSAFPDLHHTVDEIIGEKDTVAARWTIRGTHQGEFQGIAPTGKQITLTGTTIHHLAGGKIVETWLTSDNLDLMQQLGVISLPK